MRPNIQNRKLYLFYCLWVVNELSELETQENVTQNDVNVIYRGSYMSGHFIRNDHKCKILFIIRLFKMGFYRL